MLFNLDARAQVSKLDLNEDGVVDKADVEAMIDEIRNAMEPHGYVDLGLSSGTLWATTNIGAESPEDYGDYFAWGETEGYNSGKTDFFMKTYKYGYETYTTTFITKYLIENDLGYGGDIDNKTELELADDAAYVNWGDAWCIPSWQQQDELVYECTWTYTTKNGVNGNMVVGPNGNSIFLPAAGYFNGDRLAQPGIYGCYFSRSLSTFDPGNAYVLDFLSTDIGVAVNVRDAGCSIRPVRRK